jgi:hypothetical protein
MKIRKTICLRNYCLVFRDSSRVKNGETVVTSCSYGGKSLLYLLILLISRNVSVYEVLRWWILTSSASFLNEMAMLGQVLNSFVPYDVFSCEIRGVLRVFKCTGNGEKSNNCLKFLLALLHEHLNPFSPWFYHGVTSELFIIFAVVQNIVQEES